MTASAAVFPPGFRVTDANDNPVSGATIEFYNAATTTPKTVYSDSDLTVAIGTSVTTDAGGYPTSGGNKTLVYVDTSYKVIIKDELGATIAIHDRVPGPTGGGTSSTSTAATTFGMNTGDVKISASATPDAGFVRLGEATQNLTKTSYPDLNAWAAAQGYPWGSTTTTFGVPPAAGYFLRFAASSSSIDTAGARTAGSTQSDQYAAHTHENTATASTTITQNANYNNGTAELVGTGVGVSLTHPGAATITAATTVTLTNASSGTGTETRAKNVAYHADMLAVPALVSAALVGAAGLAYKFNSTTSPGSVTTGTLAFNNATLTSATALYVHETDANGTNLAAVLQGLPSGSLLWMAKVGAPATWISATLSSTATDAGAYDSFTLSTVATSATAMSNGDLMTVTAMRSGPAGATGATGATGAAGAAGATGASGPVAIDYTWDTGTTAADPGSGKIRASTGTFSGSFTLYMSETDRLGNNLATFIQSWDDSTNTSSKGLLEIIDLATPANRVFLNVTGTVTDSGSYDQISVTYKSGVTSFSAVNVGLLFMPAGDKGADGAGTGDVTGPASSVDSEIALFSSTTGKVIKRASLTGIVKAASGVASAATAGTDYMHPGTTSTITKGFDVTPNNIGTVSSGTTTPAPANGNYQYYTNNGAHTLAAPASDCAIDILVTNGASAGAITFSGFTVGSSTGSALTTTNTNKFIISIRRVNAVSTYSIYALQ